jgi:hypothetical protein
MWTKRDSAGNKFFATGTATAAPRLPATGVVVVVVVVLLVVLIVVLVGGIGV